MGNTHRPHPGPLLGLFRCRPLSPSELAGYALLGAGASFGPLVTGWLVDAQAYARFGPAAAAAWSRPWYLLSLGGLLAFSLLVGVRLWASRERLAVHANGLVLYCGRRSFLPWKSLEGVAVETTAARFLGLKLKERVHGVLYPTTGKPLRLPHGMPGQAELLSQVKAHLYKELRPELEARLSAGAWVYFGPLAINQHNLRLQNGRPRRDFNWNQIQSLSVDAGWLVIETPSRPRRLPVGKIPNFELLLELIERRITP